MNVLNQSAFLKALGWTLLDSLWQIGILWLLYVLLTANGKKFQSRQRHSMALLSLAGGSLWFLITLVVNLYKAASAPEVITVYVSNNSNEVVTTPSTFLGQIAAWFEPLLPFLSVVYLIAIGFLFIRFYRQYRYTQKLFTSGLQKADPALRVFLQQTLQHLGIKKKVLIWLSPLVDAPLTIGFWKPVILLPVAAINHLSIQQAEAIILHELNHIRRNDYLINLLMACADIILFFNPFVWLITNTIRKERENSCDDLVLQFRYDACAYAKALLTLEQNRLKSHQLAVAATGSSKLFLLNRVKRILTNQPVVTPVNQKLSAYLLSAVLISFIGWYNPGKVIVTTIVEKTTTQVVSNENTYSFTTPKIAAKKDAQKDPKHITRKHKVADLNKENSDEENQMDDDNNDASLASNSWYLNGDQAPAANFATAESVIEFSMPENVVTAPPANIPIQAYPFLPSQTFTTKPVEDTTLPKKYIYTYLDKQAKESLDKAMKALNQVDWQKLEKELKGKNIDINALKVELKKALQEVDWKKINQEADGTLDAINNSDAANEYSKVLSQLGNYQKHYLVRKNNIKTLQEQVVEDRLQQRTHTTTQEKTKTKCTTKSKKVVDI